MRWCTAARRRAGPRSFPRQSPSVPPSPATRPQADASACCSPAPGPSVSWRRRPSTRRTGSATGSRSALTPAAPGRRRRRPCPRPAADRPGSLRTTCSGVCRFLVVIVISLPARNVGDKTLTRPGPARRGHVSVIPDIRCSARTLMHDFRFPDELQSLLQRIPERVWTPRRPTLTQRHRPTQNYPMDRGTRALPANLTRA